MDARARAAGVRRRRARCCRVWLAAASLRALARFLIIGCGCRGRALARELRARGHAVRGTTRDPARIAEIEAAGAEALVADPDRVATLVPALDHVAVVCVLLGSASGPDLHGSRLEMLLSRLIDTTVRGVIYELPADECASGAQLVRRACERSRIPYSLLPAPAEDHNSWLAAALSAGERLVD